VQARQVFWQRIYNTINTEMIMRVDKWLKVSRLIKRRSVANEICDKNRIKINNRIVKASTEVKIGDRLEISLGETMIDLEILKVPKDKENVSVQDALELYRVISKLKLNE